MIAVISALLMPSGNSAGLFVSTITTGAPASTPAMMSGLFRFQRFRTKAASVFGSPNNFGAAAMPLTSFRYQDQTIGDPVESVSGDLCPKTCTVISVVLIEYAVSRALYGALMQMSPRQNRAERRVYLSRTCRAHRHSRPHRNRAAHPR